MERCRGVSRKGWGRAIGGNNEEGEDDVGSEGCNGKD